VTRLRQRLSTAIAVGFILFVGFVILAGSTAVSVPAAAADWSIREVAIVATVRPDGSMAVSETRTFAFPGNFHWFEQWIPLEQCDDIIDVTVREGQQPFQEVTSGDAGELPGAFSVHKTADRITIRIGFAAGSGLRTLTTEYVVLGPVVVHNDVAELYWKFVGPGWSVGSEKVTVDINLPAGATQDEVKVWLHAPLQGTIEKVSPTLVRAEVVNVPSETFVEARVTFPVQLVLASGKWSGRDGLPGILAEEAKWSRAANLKRAAMRFDVYLAPVLLLAAFGFGWLLMARYGFERRPAQKPDYFRELPGDYSPAELGVLWHFGSPTAADFVATILDLARRGWLVIEEARTEKATFLGFGGGVERTYRIWERASRPARD